MGRPSLENELNELEMFALYGRKQAELDSLNENYDHLLTVLSQVASGVITPQRVSVDLVARTWAISAPPPEVLAKEDATVQ